MKLKDIVQIAVLSVIGYGLGLGIGMLTGLLGLYSLYISAAFAAFFVGPVFVIMARKVQKRGAAILFWLIYGLLYTVMGYWVMLPLCFVAGLVSELIIGDYTRPKRVGLAFSAAMFLVSMHPVIFVKILGAEGIVKLISAFTLEQAQMMVETYTGQVILIVVLVNIVCELLAGKFGLWINRKFFEKTQKKSALQ